MTPFLLAQVIQLNCVYISTKENPSFKELLLDLGRRQGMVTSHHWIEAFPNRPGQYMSQTEQINSFMVTGDYIIVPENNSTFVISIKTDKAGYTNPMNPNPNAFMYECKGKK
jgi:hypothetical protein